MRVFLFPLRALRTLRSGVIAPIAGTNLLPPQKWQLVSVYRVLAVDRLELHSQSGC
jgi:hypothetical protein